MLTLMDCLALCELSREEVEAIAEHEHTPEIIAAELGFYLVRSRQGRLARNGGNPLPGRAGPGVAQILRRQVARPLIVVLLAAAAVSLFLGHLSDAAFITLVLAVNAAIGAIQEYKAEQSAAGLDRL